MNYYIGIDLGTSSCKGILVDRKGNILRQASREYEVEYLNDGWTQQNPDDWIKAAREIIKEIADGVNDDVKGISFGGQQHGLVMLDKNNKVIRPCILWNDSRTKEEVKYLNETVGIEKLSDYTGNIAFAGFTAPKILWVKNNEPDNFQRISKIMLPKDYLCFMMTNVFSSDYSDAAGTLLLDVKNRCWSKEMCDICGIKANMLPRLYESYEVVGKVLPEWNLKDAVVTAGGGDNATAAIGTGTIKDGDCNISLGTSGTIFVSQDRFADDQNNGLHEFCHSTGKWHLLGCILSAASARKWWLEDILQDDDYDFDEKGVSQIKDTNVMFLPYLSGERSPHNDPDCRGCFIGLSGNTTRYEMSKAIMEGVAFAIRDCLEIAKKNGVDITKASLCGGGAKSNEWRQLIADILNVEVDIPVTEQGPSYGASILAMVGAKEYSSIQEAIDSIVKVKQIIKPDPQRIDYYQKKYERFRKLYPNLKGLFI